MGKYCIRNKEKLAGAKVFEITTKENVTHCMEEFLMPRLHLTVF